MTAAAVSAPAARAMNRVMVCHLIREAQDAIESPDLRAAVFIHAAAAGLGRRDLIELLKLRARCMRLVAEVFDGAALEECRGSELDPITRPLFKAAPMIEALVEEIEREGEGA
jgi:hypothetical protein